MPLTEEQKKERKREASRKYREANREKIKEANRKYREENKEKDRLRNKNYYENNREKVRERNNKYREKNKDKIKERNKNYWEANKNMRNEAKRKYRENNPEKYHKSRRISEWKSQGVKHDDYVSLYNKYMNTDYCECCGCKLTTGKPRTSTTKCLDHCHITGLFRRVICNGCNVKLPKQPKQHPQIINNININEDIS
jgi:phosphoglycolate phosphatase-like HAD superfamily hydrolase